MNGETPPHRDIPRDPLYESPSSFDGTPVAPLAGCIVSLIAVDFSRDRAESEAGSGLPGIFGYCRLVSRSATEREPDHGLLTPREHVRS